MPHTEAADGALGANAAHLFRHLNDAAELRSNPLVARFFASAPDGAPSEQEAAVLVAVRERVARACETRKKRDLAVNAALAERRYAIVVRCDLQGETRKAVARDLGISLRHFCRERAVARERVARLLLEDLARPQLRAVDLHRAAVARAIMFAELGRDADAIREFRTLASIAESAQDRFQAFAALAAVERDWGRLDEAGAVLEFASASAATNAPPAEMQIARSILALARTELAAERGEIAKAQRGFAELAALLPYLTSLDAPGAAETVAGILRAQTMDAFERGQRNEVLEHAAKGLDVLAFAALPPSIRTDFVHAQTLALYDNGLIDAATARTRLLELLRAAQLCGCLSQSAKLFCSLAYVSPPAESRTYLSAGARVAREHGARAIQRTVSLTLSAAAALSGDYAQAEAELDASQRYGKGTSLQRIVAAYNRSLLLVARGRNADAFSLLSDAYATAKRVGNDRARGALLRSMASIQIKSGDRSEALGLIEASLPIIEHHGSQLSLQLALEIHQELADRRKATAAAGRRRIAIT